MAQEKNYENRIKRWLEKNGVYALGTPDDKMSARPIGYYIKRWGGGQYVKKGYPDMQIVIFGICFEVEVKAQNGIVSELQKQKLRQIHNSQGNSFVSRPSEFGGLKKLIADRLREGGYGKTAERFLL